MKLLVIERLMALNILPKEGNITTLRIVRELREALSFSEEEHKVLQFEEMDGQLRWRVDVPAEVTLKEIKVGDKAKQILAAELEKMNQAEKLTEQHFSLYEKFCAEKGD